MLVPGVACLNSNPRQSQWDAPHLAGGFVAVNGCVSERGLECDEQLNDSARYIHATAGLQLGHGLDLPSLLQNCLYGYHMYRPFDSEAMPMIPPLAVL